MPTTSFTLAVLKPEIASGFYNFIAPSTSASPPLFGRDGSDPSEETVDEAAEGDASARSQHSSIASVSAIEAALLLPNGEILTKLFTRIAQAGFVVQQSRMLQFTKAQVRTMYAHELVTRLNHDEAQFSALLEYFTRGLSLALLLALPESTHCDDAIVTWKRLVGNADPVLARQDALSSSLPHDEWPLHALCGLNSVQNGIQSSANLDCFYRERFAVFPSSPALSSDSMTRAIVVLLPTFLNSWPEGKARLVAQLNAGGIVVTKTIEDYLVSSSRGHKLLLSELHPSTNDQLREEYTQQLHNAINAAGVSCLLVLEGMNLDNTLRGILGPSSLDTARVYFPESIRAHLQSPLPCLAHVKTTENTTPCLETGLFVTFDAHAIQHALMEGDRSHEIEHTFALIKPGTASNPEAVSAIQSAIRAFGFTITTQRRLVPTRAQAAAFYDEHRGKVFFERLLAFMTSGKLVAMQLTRVNAVMMWRALMGPTNALIARETHPWTLRARFGVDGTRNATHGSDSLMSARRELRFFFGDDGAPSSRAFAAAVALASTTKQPLASIVAANRIAHMPLPTPRYPPQQTLEAVLVQALDAMLQCEVGSQLDVCAWLGKWLLEYAANQQDRLTSDIPLKDEAASRKCAVAPVKQTKAVTNTQRLATAQFVFVDVASELEAPLIHGDVESCVKALVVRFTAAGKRRFVLHDASRAFLDTWATQCGHWSVTYLVSLEPSQGAAPLTSNDMKPWTPQVAYRLSATATSSTLSTLFSPIFHPTLVVVHDTQQLLPVTKWRALAKRWGFVVLAWEQLLQARITRERDPNGVFSQWQRTKASMPSEMLLTLVHDAIYAVPGSDNADEEESRGITNKLLVCGFPLATCSPASFEKHVGSIYRVVHVHNDKTGVTVPEEHEEDAWLSYARKRGVIADLKDPHANTSPRIGLCIHDMRHDDKLRAQLHETARAHGFLWLDVNEIADPSASESDVIANLKQVVLRANAPGREQVLIYGFPRSKTAANAFIAAVGVPAFVIHCSSASEATSTAESLAVWDAYSQIVQLEITPNTIRAALQRLFFGKSVSFVVGDSTDVNSATLRDLMSVLGYATLDLRKRPDEKAANVDSLEDVADDIVHRIQAVHAPRCIVLGGPAHLAFFQVLEAVVGSAIEKIVILKHVEQRPPSRIRSDSDEDYDSDEADEQERQRQLSAQRVSPELQELLQFYAPSKGRDSSGSGVTITKVTFVKLGDNAYAQLRALLRPIVIGVIGHPHTFYRAAVACYARRHQLGVVRLSSAASAANQSNQSCSTAQKPQSRLDERLAALQQLITETSFMTYFVDGFPRATEDTSLSPAPYAAQQVWALETVASMPALVRFTASMDVLVERKPALLSRLALEDAQDTLEAQTRDTLAFFSGASRPQSSEQQRRVLSVNCERELRDAQEELDDTLLRHGLIR
uniref:Nucleoside diphosphate kinase-like domain-containing protein n=1 Tax=Globisporangium ultimum (strain ATCC 200006 / CBS 805.95 / DAOM BR144) TaxID=431595 RepID=K3X157_GLOUD